MSTSLRTNLGKTLDGTSAMTTCGERKLTRSEGSAGLMRDPSVVNQHKKEIPDRYMVCSACSSTVTKMFLVDNGCMRC